MFNKKEYNKQWNKNNPEKVKEISKRSYVKNRKKRLEHVKEYSRKNRKKISEYMKEYRKQYYEMHCEKIKEYNRLWNKNHPENIKEASRKYRENNPERKHYNKESHRLYMNMKRKTDLKFNLNHKISREIYKALRWNKAGRHWEILVGYTLNHLIKRLNKTLPDGYAWQDFLEGKLHIDHILPIAVHNFDKSEHIDFKRCWALSNLQLLTAKANLMKHTKLTKPFQLALKI